MLQSLRIYITCFSANANECTHLPRAIELTQCRPTIVWEQKNLDPDERGMDETPGPRDYFLGWGVDSTHFKASYIALDAHVLTAAKNKKNLIHNLDEIKLLFRRRKKANQMSRILATKIIKMKTFWHS
jgi:hypothetical protein